MREIKFRAWDKVKGGMYPVSTLRLYGVEYGADIAGYTYTDENGRYVSVDGTFYWYLDGLETDIELMQYTGLKDKNGKEIYEGDIVKEYMVGLGCGSLRKYEEISKRVRRIAGVEWNEDELTFEIEDTRIGVLNRWNNLEVIGNIYENPELLEK